MHVGLLGPLEVRDESGQAIEVAGTRLRSVLTRLALDAGRPVPVSVLVDAVWGEQPPSDEGNALQTLMSRLRRAIGAAATVAQGPSGYRLDIGPDDVDVTRFEAFASQGATALRAGDAERASVLLHSALGLWRGEALADGGDAVQTRRARLDDLRLAAIVDRAEAEIQLGRAGQLVAELEALNSEHPLHERLAGQLVAALAAAGRQADALGAYERVRCRLADELGVDPSPALQEVYLAVLRGELAEPERPGASTRRTNLKAQLTSFVGRDVEVQRVSDALGVARLVTVLGPGGAGKTRLASEAAAGCEETSSDGVWMVELAPVLDPAEVPYAVLATLGRRDATMLDARIPRAPREALDQLVQTLATRSTLLVLDNCEHLLEAAASLADHLLGQCSRLRVLATSREPLGIVGETLVLLPPLGTPAVDDPPAVALNYPAVELFADRAAAVSPGFVVDADTVGPVIEIVRRLDGQPLAIELAAARLRSMPVHEIAARLSDRFRLLVGSRTAMPRHRTLRAVVEWSWDLLTVPERLLVERLAVFPAGVTVASASAVCADSVVPVAEIADLLAGLVDRSLLQLRGAERPRYRMLETIREFGAERLAERGELASMRAAHADYFTSLAEEEVPLLRGSGQLTAMRVIEDDHDNLLAALRELCDSGRTDRAHELASALNGYWAVSGRHGEAATWLDVVLAMPEPASRELRLEIETAQVANSMASVSHAQATGEMPHVRIAKLGVDLAGVGPFERPMLAVLAPVVLFFSQHNEDALVALERGRVHPDPWVRATNESFAARFAENEGKLDDVARSLAIAEEGYRELGDRWGQASVLPLSAQLDIYAGELETARAKLERALDLIGELGSTDTDDQMFIEMRLAEVLVRLGDRDAGRAHIVRASEFADRTGTPEWLAIMSAMRGAFEVEMGNVAEAERLQSEAEGLFEGHDMITFPLDHGRALVGALGTQLDLKLGRLEAAARRLRTVWPDALNTRDNPIISAVTVGLAGVHAALGKPRDAAELLGVAARLRGADDPTSPTVIAVVDQVRPQLGAESYGELWTSGWALTSVEAIARAEHLLDAL